MNRFIISKQLNNNNHFLNEIWIYHISNYCPDCRISQPPPACIRDLQHHMRLSREDNDQIELGW